MYLLVLLPCVSQQLTLKMMTEKEREKQGTHSSVSCQSFLTHQ